MCVCLWLVRADHHRNSLKPAPVTSTLIIQTHYQNVTFAAEAEVVDQTSRQYLAVMEEVRPVEASLAIYHRSSVLKLTNINTANTLTTGLCLTDKTGIHENRTVQTVDAVDQYCDQDKDHETKQQAKDQDRMAQNQEQFKTKHQVQTNVGRHSVKNSSNWWCFGPILRARPHVLTLDAKEMRVQQWLPIYSKSTNN